MNGTFVLQNLEFAPLLFVMLALAEHGKSKNYWRCEELWELVMVCAYIVDTAQKLPFFFNSHPTIPLQMWFQPPQCQLPNFSESLKLLNGKFHQWTVVKVHTIWRNKMDSYTLTCHPTSAKSHSFIKIFMIRALLPHKLFHTHLG